MVGIIVMTLRIPNFVRCRKCGMAYHPGKGACHVCGTPVGETNDNTTNVTNATNFVHCRKCGVAYDPSYGKCPVCGAPVGATNSEALKPSNIVHCSKCGIACNPNNGKCPICGTPLWSPGGGDTYPSESKKAAAPAEPTNNETPAEKSEKHFVDDFDN